MNKRYVSIWLRHWSTERLRRADGGQHQGALALVVAISGGVRISAVDPTAAAEGIRSGMTLADARALLPGLSAVPAVPDADAKALTGFAEWCGRYTPFVAVDGLDGAILDISGCAHLFGGEQRLLDDLQGRLRRMAVTARIAAADTPGAAWAWARYGHGVSIAQGKTRDAVAPLPIAALRLPSESIERLEELGLHRIGDLLALPRAPLARRCGLALLDRLDRVLGGVSEPISPLRPAPEWRTRMAFAEPIGRTEDIAHATGRLLEQLCELLGRSDRGVRQLGLALYRVDGTLQRLAIGTGRASRDPRHLYKLFAEKLDQADPGFGIEVMILEARATDPMAADQLGMSGGTGGDGDDLDPLIDRLRNRLGDNGVFRIAPVASHLPERAVTIRPATDALDCDGWMTDQPRPIRLLPCPEPIEAVTPRPDDAPVHFVWRRLAHQVSQAEGPERIAPEWWRHDASRRFRDYYCLQDLEGRRFWVFRDGTHAAETPAQWYMHGLFA